jgi:hypothetical protein
VRAGFTGTLRAAGYGLTGPTATQTAHLVGANRTFDPGQPAAGPSVAKMTVNAPAGSKAVQFATFDGDYPAGTDLDVYVYKGGALVGLSAGVTADETVSLPGSGAFDVYVVQYALGGGRTEQDVHLHTTVVAPTNAGNFTVTPASQSVTAGQAVTVTAAWSGLTAGTRYFGVIEYSDATGPQALTLFSVQA